MFNAIAFTLAVPSAIACMWVLSTLTAPKRVCGGASWVRLECPVDGVVIHVKAADFLDWESACAG